MMKRGTGMFVGWKERLFLLTSKQLVYFEAGRLSAIKGSLMLRDIKGFDMALPTSKYGKKFCLALARTGPSPTWVLRTDTESDFIRWRDALRRKDCPDWSFWESCLLCSKPILNFESKHTQRPHRVLCCVVTQMRLMRRVLCT
jgi:hypothetical protein